MKKFFCACCACVACFAWAAEPPVLADVDVAVVGGTSAGVAAAVSFALPGGKVVSLRPHGFYLGE